MAFSVEQRKAHRAQKRLVKQLTDAAESLLFPKVNKSVPDPLPQQLDPLDVVFDSVICDWLTISHPLREAHPVINDGQILRIKLDGTTEWTSECWYTLKCPSSDTSLRIKCDGQKIMMTGNIGRFGQSDNLNGHTVAECLELWRKLLADYFPAVSGFCGPDFEMVNRITGEVELSGTRITRCDLAGNFFTDNFSALSAMLMTRKLGQRPPRAGKFGPMWGYDSKRANWLKAKVYDKSCELDGRRTPATGATTARFEVQLGSEILKRRGQHDAASWMKGNEMENVIFREFSKQVFRDQATAESWMDIPAGLRQYAVLWRDGVPLRAQCKSDATFYRVRRKLLEHGIDASQPCNVMTLVRRIEVVKVVPLPARRVA
jgi:hypothetical protein